MWSSTASRFVHWCDVDDSGAQMLHHPVLELATTGTLVHRFAASGCCVVVVTDRLGSDDSFGPHLKDRFN